MSSRAESEKQKLIQDKCQLILSNLLREEDNKYCVDCDAKGPRWASWNLGIFLCIRCAGIHRNLGVHISKVKSVNLDTWTPEQVACLQQMGNSQARAVYEANLPDSFRRPQTDSSLESFIRAKYEQKKYIAKEWVPPPAPKPAFDIEEERRKEKERKKTRTKFATQVEIPPLPQHPTALPRPHTVPQSPSTKTGFVDALKSSVPTSSSGDLLSLGDNPTIGEEIIFDSFLSAPLSSAKSPSAAPVVSNKSLITETTTSSEENDFFKQKFTPDTVQSNKMTKESILSLYGSTNCPMPPTQPVPPVYGMPGPVFVRQPTFAPVGMVGFPPVTNPGINVNNPGTNFTPVYNPFATLGTSALPPDARHQPNLWIGLPSTGGGDDSLLMTHGIGQVQQQMANLQLTGQAWNVGVSVPPVNTTNVINPGQPGAGTSWSNPHGRSLSSNLWQ